MSNDYETSIAFEKYESTFWKLGVNKEFDLANMGDNYSFKFFCTAPPVNEMNECIDTNGCLKSHEKLISADDGFKKTAISLTANFPDNRGFEIALNNMNEDDELIDVDIDAYEGVRGYYYNGRFYNDPAHSSILPYYEGHLHFDWSNYNPEDSENDYGIVTYSCDGSSYTETTKPAWIDYEGNIIVKAMFLVNDDDFVLSYCRYSTPINVRDVITLPIGSKFVKIGACEQ